MGKSISIPYRFIILSEDIEEVKKMRVYNNQVIPDKSTAIAVDTNEQFIFQDGKWIKVIEDGMTIDKAIDIMGHYEEYGFISQRKGRDFAIDIMCKYQQIEQIVKLYKRFGNIDLSMQIISGVIENGNNNQHN